MVETGSPTHPVSVAAASWWTQWEGVRSVKSVPLARAGTSDRVCSLSVDAFATTRLASGVVHGRARHNRLPGQSAAQPPIPSRLPARTALASTSCLQTFALSSVAGPSRVTPVKPLMLTPRLRRKAAPPAPAVSLTIPTTRK